MAPDGSRIAFLGDLVTNGVTELFTALPFGVITLRVSVSGTIVVGGNVFDFRWAPDGSHIAFVGDLATNDVLDLFTALPVPGPDDQRVRVSGIAVANGDVTRESSNSFAWFPDSSRIAFVGDLRTNDVFEIFTAAPGDDDSPRVLSGGIPVSEFEGLAVFGSSPSP